MIDSHAHLTDRRISPVVLDVRSGYLKSGITTVLDVGCSVSSSLLAKQNAESFSEVYFTAGCHPDDAGSVNATTLLQIKELSSHKKCLAIGEIGLDYHYLNFDKAVQKNAFISQLQIAVEVQKPVVIHTRDACKDTVDILTDFAPKLKGFIMHCYSESKETAKTLLNLGAYFSFGGPCTFKNARKVVESVREIPMDRILSETDCPFLTPEPYRGQFPNEPKNIPHIVKRIAEIKGVSQEQMQEQIYENAKRLFFKLR